MSSPKLARSTSLIQADLKAAIEKFGDTKVPYIWLQKTRNSFNFLDPEQTGEATRESIKIITDRLVKYGELPKEEVQKIEKVALDWYEDVMKTEEKMSFDYFYKMRYVIQTNAQLQEDCQAYVFDYFRNWFDIIDSNHDGIISKKEWQIYFKVLGGYDASIADEIFKKVDLNSDGVISRDEYVHACDTCLNSMESTEFDCFFGPLSDVKV